MPKSVMHCRRIDGAMPARSSISRRSGLLIFRTSPQKNRAQLSSSNFGVQVLDLAFASVLALAPDSRIRGPGRLFQQLLLPGIDLVRAALGPIFAFSAASILRLILVVTMRSVY